MSLAEPRPGQRILDVGTGTGIVALQAARRVEAHGRALGIDVASEMLDEARAEAATAGLTNVEFRKLDAQSLPFERASFDAVCSLFALAHVPDPAGALREMHRVLRPAGRLVLGVGAGPPLLHGSRWRRLPLRLESWRGRCLLAPGLVASRLFREGVRLEPAPSLAPAALPHLLRQAGFVDLSAWWEGGEAAVATPEELWEVETTFSTPVRSWLAAATPAEAEAAHRALIGEADRVLARGGRLAYLSGARLLTARRAAG